MSYKFKPVSVVSVIVTVGSRFLIVEERLGNGLPVYNTPSGHLEHWEEVLAIYGSSTFTTSEMSYFIDCIIQDAKALGIPVMSDSEIALLKEEWT